MPGFLSAHGCEPCESHLWADRITVVSRTDHRCDSISSSVDGGYFVLDYKEILVILFFFFIREGELKPYMRLLPGLV